MGKPSQFESFIILSPDGIIRCASCAKKGITKTFSGSGGTSNIGRHVKADHAEELGAIRLAKPQPRQARLPFAPLQSTGIYLSQ